MATSLVPVTWRSFPGHFWRVNSHHHIALPQWTALVCHCSRWKTETLQYGAVKEFSFLMWFLAMCGHIEGKAGNRDTRNQATCPRAGIFQGRTFRMSTSMLSSVDHNIPYIHGRKHCRAFCLQHYSSTWMKLRFTFPIGFWACWKSAFFFWDRVSICSSGWLESHSTLALT